MRCWRPERRTGAGLSALAAVALVALLPACGDEKREFRDKQLNPLVRRLAEERATLATVLRASRPKRRRDEAALRDQLRALSGVMRRIAALRPPDGVEERFERYTRANAALLRELDRFVGAFARGDEAGQTEAGRRARESVARANRAQRELQGALR